MNKSLKAEVIEYHDKYLTSLKHYSLEENRPSMCQIDTLNLIMHE